MINLLNPVKIVQRLIPYDKALHYIVGNATAIPVIFGMMLLNLSPFKVTIYCLAIICALAVFKEVYDRLSHTGTVDANDVVYTLLGGLSALVTYLMGVSMK